MLCIDITYHMALLERCVYVIEYNIKISRKRGLSKIQENFTSESFPRRISGNPGNLPLGKFPGMFYLIICYVFL